MTDRDRHDAKDDAHFVSERSVLWAATMQGFTSSIDPSVRVAHEVDTSKPFTVTPIRREEREAAEKSALVAGATHAIGAGYRERSEEPDPFRTCFERDRDRVHAFGGVPEA